MATRKARRPAPRKLSVNKPRPKLAGARVLKALVGSHAAFRLAASNDTVVLLQELDECAARLDQAIIETETKANQAEIDGDSASKARLENLAEKQRSQRTKVANKRIKIRDESPEMQQAIEGFSAVNDQIETSVNQNLRYKRYLEVMTQIAQALDVLIKLALL